MKARKTGGKTPQPAVAVDGEVIRQIRQHAATCAILQQGGGLRRPDRK